MVLRERQIYFFTLISLTLRRDAHTLYISKSHQIPDAFTPILYFTSICFASKSAIYNQGFLLIFTLTHLEDLQPPISPQQNFTNFYNTIVYNLINIMNLMAPVK